MEVQGSYPSEQKDLYDDGYALLEGTVLPRFQPRARMGTPESMPEWHRGSDCFDDIDRERRESQALASSEQ